MNVCITIYGDDSTHPLFAGFTGFFIKFCIAFCAIIHFKKFWNMLPTYMSPPVEGVTATSITAICTLSHEGQSLQITLLSCFLSFSVPEEGCSACTSNTTACQEVLLWNRSNIGAWKSWNRLGLLKTTDRYFVPAGRTQDALFEMVSFV